VEKEPGETVLGDLSFSPSAEFDSRSGWGTCNTSIGGGRSLLIEEVSGMNRGSGVGLIGGGIALVVVGAILEFAVSVSAKGFNIHTVGVILLSVGIAAFVVGLVLVVAGGTRRATMREDVRNTPGGHERIVEERDNLAS